MEGLTCEVLLKILRFLNLGDKMACREASAAFKYVLDEFELKFTPVLCNRTFQYISRSEVNMTSVTITEMDVSDPELARSASRCRYTNRFDSISVNPPSGLRNSETFCNNVRRLLQKNQHITCMGINSNFWQYQRNHISCFVLRLECLQELQISFSSGIENSLPFLDGLEVPSLRRLTISQTNDRSCSFKEYAKIYKFVSSIAGALHSLTIHHAISIARVRSVHLLSQQQQQEAQSIMGLLQNITASNFSICMHPMEERYHSLGLSIANNQQYLQKLNVTSRFLSNFDVILSQIISTNCTSLKTVSITGQKSDEVNEVIWSLRKCFGLKSLRLHLIKISEYFELPETIEELSIRAHVIEGYSWAEIGKLKKLKSFTFGNYNMFHEDPSDELIHSLLSVDGLEVIFWQKFSMPVVTLDVLYRSGRLKSMQIFCMESQLSDGMKPEKFYRIML